jgi:protein-disulfide isomerase
VHFLISFILSITFLYSDPASCQVLSLGVEKAATVKKASASEAQSALDWREKLARNAKAPVNVTEFFDYQCPFCASTLSALKDALKNNAGRVQLILKHTPLPIHPDSMLAHQAALAAGEQGRFWEMHDLLFAHQRRLKLPDLLEYARQLHLNMPLFQSRLQSQYYKAAVERDIAEANALGVDGTPTFFINGRKLIGAQSAQRLESMISGKTRPEEVGTDISRLDLTDAPVRGAAGAPVTIIEFSDLQCPFCARVAPTLQQLLAEYPDKIKWVFKSFPLDFHLDSPLAHQAVLAAGEQGKFWEMHDLVFAGQSSIKRDDLLQKARRLNLDMARFMADLDSEKIKRRVETDKREGAALGLYSTPTFFINSKQYSGAMPLQQFEAIIKRELALAPTPPSATTGVNDAEISVGPPDAPITLLWFSDLQSNLTLRATLVLRQIMKSHPGKVRLVFKNRPLESHPGAMLLHQASMAANAQGKFWEMHDLIIADPRKTAKQDLIGYARRIGLDVKRFESDLETNKYRPAVLRDLEEARRRAVLGTPVFFLNGTRIDGIQPQNVFDELIAAQSTQMAHSGPR